MAVTSPSQIENGVLIGKLSSNESANEMAKNVFHLLKRLGIQSSDIAKISINAEAGYAKVNVRLAECEDYIVKMLMEVKSRYIAHSLTNILEDPEQLFVVRISQALNQQNQTESSDPRPAKDAPDGSGLSSTPGPGKQAYEIEDLVKVPVDFGKDYKSNIGSLQAGTSAMELGLQDLGNTNSRPSLDKTTSTPSFPPWEIGPEAAERPVMLSAKTSTPFSYPCDCPETVFYHRLQDIGTESRYREFKKGGVIYDQWAFKETIGKYVCGFLNSEGGTLFFGVSDAGVVLGITLDQEMEDELRWDIQFAVRCIEPDVTASEYSVNFARVMRHSGELSADLKVLEICVRPRCSPAVLYSYKGSVYLRRDGSLQVLGEDRTRNK